MDSVKAYLALFGITAVVIGIIVATMWAYPQYSVWQQEMAGRAALAKATQDRQIKVQEAKAFEESAKYQANAEVIRAKGVAESNHIIGEGLKGNDEYLRYLWIQAMGEKDDSTTIYVPIGNDGLPLMKAVK